jgi:thioesterase domain-containing protein/SAM-dependent methyltransferase
VDSTYSVWPEPAPGYAPEPIGLPVSNLRAHVLDRHLGPLPVGVPGELYLSGDSLARGYLHRPAQTAERFLPDPLSTAPGARLYRTGDLARRLSDGQLEYLGRLDHQVKIRGQRVELGEIEAQIVAQPGVRDAVVTLLEDGGDLRLVAHVVPAPEDPADEAAERASREEARVEQWQSLYEEVYRTEAETDAAFDPSFDIRGWNSSYTGEPLPAGEMRRWLDSTVARILDLRPRRVLEIGCGTGLILFAVAPHTERYLATDFSGPVIENLRRNVSRLGLAERVELERRPAHGLAGLPPGAFDTVILNSVVQYFPGAQYLAAVLEQAAAALAEGGSIFLGDLRSLPLLEAYHASVQLHQAAPELTGAELLRRIDAQRRREEELALDPAFFQALRTRLPRLADVTVQVKRGGDLNELTRYRYDVVLHLDRPRARPAAVRVERLENPRVGAELHLLGWLRERGGDAARATVAELRERLADAPTAPDPEVYWRLCEERGYRVEVGWAADGEPGDLEVRLYDPASPPTQATEAIAAIVPDGDLARFASDPLPGRWRRTFVPELRRRLEERLPGYMVPQALVCLEALPLTPNGKVDRAALPPPDRDALVSRDGHEPPETATEQRLAEIWKGLLDVERVGRRDGFFDLGGHSLMVVMLAAAIRNGLGVDVPVPRLFERVILESQAALIDSLRSASGESAGEPAGIVTRLNDADGRPVFCFPPLLGYGLAFLGIGRRIASHALWAFDFPEGDPDPLGRFARRIEEIQPEGPLVFLGYSAGGPVALEVARLLEERGRTVTDLIFLDSAVVDRRPELSDTELDDLVTENLDYFEGFILSDPQLRQRYLDDGARAAMAAKMRGYLRFLDGLRHAGPPSANVHLIHSTDQNGNGRRDWRGLVRGEVRFYQGAGRHVDMVADEHVDTNAALVAGILETLD